MQPVGHSIKPALPLPRGTGREAVAPERPAGITASGRAIPNDGGAPKVSRISGSTGASQDALLRYGSTAQIRPAAVPGSHIDVFV